MRWGPVAQEEEAVEAAAQDAVTSELQRRATARAAWHLAARRSALDWLRHPVRPATAEFVSEWLAVLRDALARLYPAAVAATPAAQNCALPGATPAQAAPDGASAEGLDPALAGIAAGHLSEDNRGAAAALATSAAGSEGGAAAAVLNGDGRVATGTAVGQNGGGSVAFGPYRRANPVMLTEAMDAIRELGSLHVSLPLLASTEILQTMQQLTLHTVPSLSLTYNDLIL